MSPLSDDLLRNASYRDILRQARLLEIALAARITQLEQSVPSFPAPALRVTASSAGFTEEIAGRAITVNNVTPVNFAPLGWSSFQDGDGGLTIDFPLPVGSYSKYCACYATVGAPNGNLISGFNGTQHVLWGQGGGLTLAAGHNNSYFMVQDTDSMLVSTVYRVGVTFEATTGRLALFRNGVLRAQATVGSNPGGGHTRIGAFDLSNAWRGYIHRPAIWNLALTDEQMIEATTNGV